jgi:hypothetical protein
MGTRTDKLLRTPPRATRHAAAHGTKKNRMADDAVFSLLCVTNSSPASPLVSLEKQQIKKKLSQL